MSTTGTTVTINPLGTGAHEGTVVGTVPRTDGPRPDVRVRIGDAIYRIPSEDLPDR